MSRYRPGVWARKFRALPPLQKEQINQKTNTIFANTTGVTRKLDPTRDRSMCDLWLQIRDEVVAGKHQGLLAGAARNATGLATAIRNVANSATSMINNAMSPAPWMNIARAELNKEVKEIEGEKHNPEVMKYIRSCPDLYATENKTRYTEREGEEGVKWCSAFVNWCMKQAGFSGTNSARALSWRTYGEECMEPRAGAIVVTKGTKYRHVAFVEEVGGELKMLGGNQQKSAGGGGYNQVSIRPINENIVVAYRWPK